MKIEKKTILTHLLIRALPRDCELEAHEVLGLHNSMDKFVGRQKKST